MVYNSFFAFHISSIGYINHKKGGIDTALLPRCIYFCQLKKNNNGKANLNKTIGENPDFGLERSGEKNTIVARGTTTEMG